MNNTNIREELAKNWWYETLTFKQQSALKETHGTFSIQKLYDLEHPQQPTSLFEQMAEVTKPDSEMLLDLTILRNVTRAIEQEDDKESQFYMNICRAYNAGKQNQIDILTGDSSFVSSHDYFVGEFPTFKTNVP